jgi:hypothetical protein
VATGKRTGGHWGPQNARAVRTSLKQFFMAKMVYCLEVPSKFTQSSLAMHLLMLFGTWYIYNGQSERNKTSNRKPSPFLLQKNKGRLSVSSNLSRQIWDWRFSYACNKAGG